MSKAKPFLICALVPLEAAKNINVANKYNYFFKVRMKNK